MSTRADEAVNQLGWKPLSLVPTDNQTRRCRQCAGAFVDPLANQPTDNSLTDSIKNSAENASRTKTRRLSENNVTIKQDNRFVHTDKATFYLDEQQGLGEGNIILREPGLILTGDSIKLDIKNDELELENVNFAMHESQLNGSAKKLVRKQDKSIEVDKGTVTFCAPSNPTWALKANNIEFDPQNGEGIAHHATVEIIGVPVFYSPWMRFFFDDRRKTGLLFPSIGADTRGGLDITTPLYLNLAPNYDATYAPRVIGERGLMHQVNGRWLSENIGYWEINGNYLEEDDKLKQENPDNNSAERWLLSVQQQGYFNNRWRSTINYGKVSDPNYFRDINQNILSLQRETALLQLGELDYLGRDWTVNIQVQQFQPLVNRLPNNYKKLPQITTTWLGNVNWGGFEPIGQLQYSNFGIDDNSKVSGQRIYTETGITYPFYRAYGSLLPTIKYRRVDYALNEPLADTDSSPSAGSAVASLDGSLVFERSLQIGSKAMTQTLEPRAFYLYSQYEDQTDQPKFDSAELTFSYNQLFRDTRFSGHDRLDDANQMALGLTTQLFSNDDNRKQLSASIGQIFYFNDRKVRLNTASLDLNEKQSAIAATFSWLPTAQWEIDSNLLYGDNKKFDAVNTQTSYTSGNGSIFNVGYALRRRRSNGSQQNEVAFEQASFSAYYPIDHNWSIFGALNYSLKILEPVEDMIGFEYDGCCWQMRMLYMRYINSNGNLVSNLLGPNLEREKSIQVQFVLKGIGGIGHGIEDLLMSKIRGFNP